jgi:hypothetical protein
MQSSVWTVDRPVRGLLRPTVTNNTILVIGSTGKTGTRVVHQLENRGIPVRHGSRSADVPFDWDNPQTWPAALAGAGKVYLTYYPDLAVPGAVDAVGRLTELSQDAGGSRLVPPSGRNEPEAEKAERIVMASRPGVDDCALRVLRAELQRGRVARRGARRRRSPTACSGRWAASPRTSPTTPATPPQRVCGRRRFESR